MNGNTNCEDLQREQTVAFVIYKVANHGAHEKRDRTQQNYARYPWITPGAIWPRQIRLAYAQHDQREVSHRVVRYKEESERGQHLLETPENEKHCHDGADKQSHRGSAALIYPGGAAREELVTAHRIENPRRG